MMKHFWESIDGWCHYTPLIAEMIRDCDSKRRSTIVELGVWKGKSSAFLGVEAINSGKPITHVMVDHFKGTAGEAQHEQDEDVKAGRLRDVFWANTAPLRGMATSEGYQFHLHPSDTIEAAKHYDRVDYVLVDAGHTFDDVMRDLTAWVPKIDRGGVIGGDDYDWPGVKRAVHAYFGLVGLTVHVCSPWKFPYWYVVMP
jgi:hypothetical protein